MTKRILAGAQFFATIFLCICADPIAETVLQLIGG